MKFAKAFILILLACVVGFSFTACQTMQAKSAATAKIKPPIVTLDSVEVAHYWGYWWFHKKKSKPIKGKLQGHTGAPLDLAFIFNITNPNPYPVELNGFKFTISFEEFELNTVNYYETMWIPAGKTNQLRVHAMFDVATAMLSLGVTGGFKLKAKKMSLWAQLEKWWTGIQSFSFPIKVSNGTAMFTNDGQSVMSTFSAVYPPPKK